MTATNYVINIILSVFLIIGAYQFYFWVQRQRLVVPRSMQLSLDERIPFWPGWVWIYSFSYYPVILAVNFAADTPEQFTYFAVSYLLLLGLQMVFFLIYPIVTPQRWRERNGEHNLSERFLTFVQRYDDRSNCFPSMHTSVAMLTAFHLYPVLGAIAFTFPSLIGLSCLFTKQHYLLDIPAGALLGIFSYAIFIRFV